MPRKGGWRREGSRGRFRYVDARGNRITEEEKLERIKSLVIPPAWKDVWISPSSSTKLQATGVDAAGRKQYLYPAAFRAQREQEKFDRLIRFAERLPDLRAAMAENMDDDALDRERVSAIATRLINRAWFRVGTERYAKKSQTFGITTLRKGHVSVRGNALPSTFEASTARSSAPPSSTPSWRRRSTSCSPCRAAAGFSGTTGRGACARSTARVSTTTCVGI
ncbi:hypothetical protein BH18ACT12_BH18ACT12_21470 [soil metagenome]